MTHLRLSTVLLVLVGLLACAVPTSASPAPRPTGAVPQPAPTREAPAEYERLPARAYAPRPALITIDAAGQTFRIQGAIQDDLKVGFISAVDPSTRALFDLFDVNLQWSARDQEVVSLLDQQRSVMTAGRGDMQVGDRDVPLDVPLIVRGGTPYIPVAALPNLLPARLQAVSYGHYCLDPLVSALDLETPEGGGVRLTITSRVPMKYQTFMLRKPNRFVLNIPNAVLDLDRYHQVGDRVLRHPDLGDVRFDQFSFQPNVVRVVIPLGADNELRVLPRSTPRRLVVAIVKPTIQAHEVDLSTQTITDVALARTSEGVRITLKGTGPFQYEWHRLRPPDNRFFLDVPKTVLAGPRRIISVGDPYLSSVQVGQYQKEPTPTVRVLLELEQSADTRISTPPDAPNTLVLDVRHHAARDSLAVQGYGTTRAPSGGKMVVCIDPGHGGSDPGAVNRALGLQEKNITLDVARRLARELRSAGWRVVMTRNDDRDLTYPGSSASEELGARVRVATDFHADLFISIHCNASVNPNATGSSTHWYKQSDRHLAAAIHPKVINSLGCPSRGLIRNRFYVLAHCPIPSILIETAYISNAAEARKLADATQRERLAVGIADGLKGHVGSRVTARSAEVARPAPLRTRTSASSLPTPLASRSSHTTGVSRRATSSPAVTSRGTSKPNRKKTGTTRRFRATYYPGPGH